MNNFKIKLERTPAQLDLVKKLGSKNKTESMAAQEAIASVLAQPILKVINQGTPIASLYSTQTYDSGTPASIQLDPYFDVRARNMINAWSASVSGGIATNFVQGLSELFVHTYTIDSAISMNKSTLAAGNLDYLGASMTRLMEEIMLRQEVNGANALMASLAGARIDGDNTNNAAGNVVLSRTNTSRVFGPADFNALVTKYDRVLASWIGGTPATQKAGISVLVGSPEFMGAVRALAYNPVNTVSGAVLTSGASSIAAPESLREEIFKNAGIQSFFGIELRKVWELGIGRAYNTLLGGYLGSQLVTGFGGSGTAAFAPTTEEIVVGLNPSMFDLVRLRETFESGEFSLVPDDTFTTRSGKVGFYGSLREGYVSVDGRAKYGMIF